MDANKKTVAWTMTADTAMEFFKRCQERNAVTEEERVAILVELSKEGQMTSVTVTNKTREKYIEDKAKHFKILRVRKKDETD